MRRRGPRASSRAASHRQPRFRLRGSCACIRRSATRDHNPRLPARRAATGGRVYGVDIDTDACQQPRSDRVGVPHLAGAELVASPHRRRNIGDQVENALCKGRIICQPPRAVDCLVDVWDHAMTPSSDLVPEDPHRSGVAASNRALRDNSAQCPVSVTYGCRLDHELSFRHVDDEGGVVQIHGRPLLQAGHHRLVNAAVQPHGVTTGAQRKPVEINAGLALGRHAEARPDGATGASREAIGVPASFAPGAFPARNRQRAVTTVTGAGASSQRRNPQNSWSASCAQYGALEPLGSTRP